MDIDNELKEKIAEAGLNLSDEELSSVAGGALVEQWFNTERVLGR